MAGYSSDEIEDAQTRWGLKFPPDLIDLLKERRQLIGGVGEFDWTTSDPKIIADRIEWPFESFCFDVEHNVAWWPDWGARPATAAERRNCLRKIFDDAPKLIPLHSHRYLPEKPSESGNPVFSIYQTDVIHYGANLDDWLVRERGGYESRPWPTIKFIRFWSRAVEINNRPPTPTAS